MDNLFEQIDFDCWNEPARDDDLTAEEIELMKEIDKESNTQRIDEK